MLTKAVYLAAATFIGIGSPLALADESASPAGSVQEAEQIREGRDSDAHRQELQEQQHKEAGEAVHSHPADTAAQPGREGDGAHTSTDEKQRN